MRTLRAFITPCNQPVITHQPINSGPAVLVIDDSGDDQRHERPLQPQRQAVVVIDDSGADQRPERPLQTQRPENKAYGHVASLTFHR